MVFRFPATGTYTFNTINGVDADSFLYSDPLAVSATLPQALNTRRRWCWADANTTSANVGPTSGAGGAPDGYLYTEASSPAAFNDQFLLEFDTNLDASVNSIVVQFKTNQRGNNNNATCVVETNENGAGWVSRGTTFGGIGDPDKVATGGVQIWSARSVDLTGLISNALTRIRIKVVFPASGTSWHNDYGIDEIVFIGTSVGPSISTVDVDNIVDDGQTPVIISGSTFGLTDTGLATVEIGDNIIYASANKVTQTRNSWSVTSISISVSIGAQGVGTKWMWVTDSSGNRSAAFQITVVGPDIASIDTDNDIDDEQNPVLVVGSSFGSTDAGSATVELGDNAIYALANRIAQVRNSWSAASISIIVDLGSQNPGTKWIWVTDSTGKRSSGFQVAAHRAEGWVMSASSNIAVNGENTTARLIAPTTKTTADFDIGRAQDDKNPSDLVDITIDNYTEIMWSIEAQSSAREVAYSFRVTVGGVVMDALTATPQTTVIAVNLDNSVFFGMNF